MPVYLMESISYVALAVHQNANVTTRAMCVSTWRSHEVFMQMCALVKTHRSPTKQRAERDVFQSIHQQIQQGRKFRTCESGGASLCRRRINMRAARSRNSQRAVRPSQEPLAPCANILGNLSLEREWLFLNWREKRKTECVGPSAPHRAGMRHGCCAACRKPLFSACKELPKTVNTRFFLLTWQHTIVHALVKISKLSGN